MKPPDAPFDHHDSRFIHTVEHRLDELRNRKSPGPFIMSESQKLQMIIRRIHQKEQRHQDDLEVQDVIGIASRPAFQI